MQEQEHPLVVSVRPAATPLEFTVQVALPQERELDSVVESWREVDGVGEVGHIGVVDSVAVGKNYRALVRVGRIYPEFYLPPLPGSKV